MQDNSLSVPPYVGEPEVLYQDCKVFPVSGNFFDLGIVLTLSHHKVQPVVKKPKAVVKEDTAILNKIDCSHTFLASTGRMASEMVTKICRAKIPIVATKTAVTQSGLEIGKKCGLTIIGFVRDVGTKIHTDMEVRIIGEPGMKIYTNAERILGG